MSNEFNILYEEENKENDSYDKMDDFKKALKEKIEADNKKNIVDLSKIKFPINYNNKEIKNCVDKKISLEGTIFYGEVDFSNVTFKEEVNFSNVTFKEEVDFYNVTFKEEVNFSNVVFQQKTFFNGATFEAITRFNDATCKENVSFFDATFRQYVSFARLKCDKKFDLGSIEVKKLNLEEISSSEYSYLHMKGLQENKKIIITHNNFENKNSATIIKNHFESKGDISESNKYFAIEQELYLQSLISEKKELHQLPKKISLHFSKWVSNFGTNWLQPLLLLFIFSFLFSFIYSFLEPDNQTIYFTDRVLLGLLCLFFVSFLCNYLVFLGILMVLNTCVALYQPTLMDILVLINDTSRLVNPLNIFKNKNDFEGIESYGVIVKLVISTLFYQFVMVFRANIRRK